MTDVSCFVSCIMATRDRRPFVRQALRCYQGQTFTDSELILIDDGHDSVEDLCTGLPGVRYIRLNEPTTTGRKLNIGIDAARGAVVQKLDDDDYYAPCFLESATAHFLSETSNARASVVVWDCFLVLLRGSPALRFSGHGWNAGGTLCFRRQMGMGPYFRDVAANEDVFFLQDHRLRRVPVCLPELYMVVRHGANTWTASPTRPVDALLRALPIYPKALTSIVGEMDQAFYSHIAAGGDASDSQERSLFTATVHTQR